MKQGITWIRTAFAITFATILAVLAAYVPGRTQSNAIAPSGVPAFLRPNNCYRFTFAVVGAPNWKVIEVLDHGWVRGEIEAGSASAVREPVWINTAQIITVREAKCGD